MVGPGIRRRSNAASRTTGQRLMRIVISLHVNRLSEFIWRYNGQRECLVNRNLKTSGGINYFWKCDEMCEPREPPVRCIGQTRGRDRWLESQKGIFLLFFLTGREEPLSNRRVI